jgi:hypothetical protein
MKLRNTSHGLNGQQLARQDAEVAALKAQLAQVLARITQLEQQLATKISGVAVDNASSSRGQLRMRIIVKWFPKILHAVGDCASVDASEPTCPRSKLTWMRGR